MALETDVEKLRARIRALESGEVQIEATPEVEVERARTVVDFFYSEFKRIHGMPYCMLPKDAVNLVRMEKLYTPQEKFAWMLTAFLSSDDDWLREAGFSVSALTSRAQSLAFRWHKSVQEPALRKEKLALESRLRELERAPAVLSLVDRLAK